MECERGRLVSPIEEVPVIEGEIVTAIRELADRGWGSKAIARELGVARNTVRRYRRQPIVPGQQMRTPRRLTADVVREAETVYTRVAERNAVVVHRLLRKQGRVIGLRTVQRAVAPVRQAQRAADVATVRVETAPGAQLQIDFGEKRVVIAGTAVRVFLLVAVLSYSCRLFVKPFSMSARTIGARASLPRSSTSTGSRRRSSATMRGRSCSGAIARPARSSSIPPISPSATTGACSPARARRIAHGPKGKTESGVKYVKRNALAGLTFESFSALEQHLTVWMAEADRRVPWHDARGAARSLRPRRAGRVTATAGAAAAAA
jgi:transposase